MKLIIYNSRLAKRMLFPGYSTIMLFGIILTKRRKEECPPALIRHEQIHQRQYFECFILPVLPAILFTPWILDPMPFEFLYTLSGRVVHKFRTVFLGSGNDRSGQSQP